MTRGDSAKLRTEIIGKIASVPALPASAAEVIALIKDADVEISDLVKAIEYDPGLTADVLRYANSVHYARGVQIASIQDAVVRLGLKQMGKLVMTALAGPLIQGPILGYDLPPGALFERSVVVAIGAQEVANALELIAPPQTFTAGLLHDVGKIVLGTFIEVTAEPILRVADQDQVPFDEAERRVLGIDHAEVGALLLEGWNIPRDIVDVVRWHHQPDRFDGESLALDLVHTAEMCICGSAPGVGLDALHYVPDPGVTSRLKMKALVAETVVCNTWSGLEEIRETLSI